MLVYRTQQRNAHPAPLLTRLRHEVTQAEHSGTLSHQQATAWLIEFGELEAGVMDALCPHMDVPETATGTVRCLRQAALCCGHLLISCWEKRTAAAGRCLTGFRVALDALAGAALPSSVPISTPEGYAYYGLYPETYVAAANQCWHELRPERAVCIGIRSIGTSLSAVVAAAFERHGVNVCSYTVRPHGHPFDRALQLSPHLEQEWRSLNGAHFMIVDEGPGLSGSSFGSVAGQLAALGIANDRILFFPSWQADGAQLVNPAARARWQQHRKFTATFEDVWLESGRFVRELSQVRPLAQPPELPELVDLGAGEWRTRFYPEESAFPAVHPQHERRKYLLRGSPRKSPDVWLKFGGLGRYGTDKLPRAEMLADAGFAPRPLGCSHGFLQMDAVKGKPLAPGSVNPVLLTTMARYLTFLQANFPVSQVTPGEQVLEMTRHNVAEGLGESWAQRLVASEVSQHALASNRACALDGRMLPHEWMRVGFDYLKTDGLDHHDDHFYPGYQDIAWDLAGTCIEFALNPRQAESLIEQYRQLSGDADIVIRMPFYLIAYAAFRLGYATLAAETLGGSADGARFGVLSDRYARVLKREINLLGHHPGNSPGNHMSTYGAS